MALSRHIPMHAVNNRALAAQFSHKHAQETKPRWHHLPHTCKAQHRFRWAQRRCLWDMILHVLTRAKSLPCGKSFCAFGPDHADDCTTLAITSVVACISSARHGPPGDDARHPGRRPARNVR